MSTHAVGTVDLRRFSRCGGCGGKLAANTLANVLSELPRFDDPAMLVGSEGFSDSGVYLVSEDLAIVQSVDFFSPIVGDPHTFGRIAATNALSDIYAMGAAPKTALNILTCPQDDPGPEAIRDILLGASDAVREAGAVVLGGHSLRDEEVKFGLAVTGTVRPSEMLTNAGARPGDLLVLTKPLGVGMTMGAARRGEVERALYDRAVESMTCLNSGASLAALRAGAHAMTDVTGYSLGGHAYELAQASGVTIVIVLNALPLLEGLSAVIKDENLPGAVATNRAYVGEALAPCDLTYEQDAILFDPQTSGGLLISVPAEKAEELVARCLEHGCLAAAIVGSVEGRSEYALRCR
ncbi:MAG: selenide, water dikinase SelD [Phycisphaerales bacterium]